MMPVSQPGVSQHFRVRWEARLVRLSRKVATHLCEIDLAGLKRLKRWLDQFWPSFVEQTSDIEVTAVETSRETMLANRPRSCTQPKRKEKMS
jgi:hypothetical protein